MISLGIKPFGHDSCVAVVSDGKILAASTEERFNREKHSDAFPYGALDFALKEAGATTINDVGVISLIFEYKKELGYIYAWGFFRFFPHHTHNTFGRGLRQIKKILKTYRILRKELGYKGKIITVDHHDCHAAVVAYTSGFDKSAVITVDGKGEKACSRVYTFSGGRLKKQYQINFPNSLGMFYTAVTEYLGFKRQEDEGKVMGLAPYGTNKLVGKMREVVDVKTVPYRLNLRFLETHNSRDKNVSSKFVDVFGPPRKSGKPLLQRHKDIAFATQALLEEAMLGLATFTKDLTSTDKLCLSGGVILNSVANGRIAKAKLFKDTYIYPAAGDDGACVGAALLACYRTNDKHTSHKTNQTPYLGAESTEKEILSAIKNSNLNYVKSRNIAQNVAKLISQNKFVGWYQGRAEFGPRALGNRSIIVDPRKASNKELVNARIKFREPFRPFAPSVLRDHAEAYFDTGGSESPYMILAFDVKPDKRNIIPAVTHVDGTARVQTVTKQQNKRYWDVIHEFYKITGVPVLLNTSFNRMGEPIVNTPEQAITCLRESGLDAVAIGDYLVTK